MTLATVYELATSGPRTVRNMACLKKPVMRLSSVAMAMDPVADKSFDVDWVLWTGSGCFDVDTGGAGGGRGG
ncbi:hypothetical protein GCM10007304_01710 [Rhodococcoides trifolii]|uniref:Uncharacterized protein n=1 Tax=Rhodococcoides trifolii TaxID=908250 RepID=A0A917CL89_9NOCA|nr:hypothetical protein GCM10007304_01710 [Rhodococcus trifolii]